AGGALVPVEIDLFDGQINTNDADDLLISKNTYTYDNYTALGGMEDYGGQANPPGHSSIFDATVTNRGNLTGQTQWIDIAANTTITRLAKIDIFGNVTKAQVSCCSQKTYSFQQGDYWTNGGKITSGDPSSLHLIESYTYDFNTSKETGTTDPNGLSTTYQYDANLRPTISNLPSGATSTFGYVDNSQSSSLGLSYVDL